MKGPKQQVPVPLPPRRPEIVQAEYEKLLMRFGKAHFDKMVLEQHIQQLAGAIDQTIGEAQRSEKVHGPINPEAITDPTPGAPGETPAAETENKGEDNGARETGSESAETESPEAAGSQES